MQSFDEISKLIKSNPDCITNYISLGDYYLNEHNNVNQAYLCYEYAYNHSAQNDKNDILQKMNACMDSEDYSVNPFSFIILSYNSMKIMQECLNAIRNYCDLGTYETVIVDNASTDGIREWLLQQPDIKLILNDKFDGFSAGCNQGAKAASPSNDIFLLNNDAIISERSILYLRLGLYTGSDIGIAGPVSCNVIPEQLYDSTARNKDDWFSIASKINQPLEPALQFSHWLQGHAMLIKRKVWDEIGGLDTNCRFGGAEDLEYTIRANSMGYKTCICKNAFIYHYGSTSMKTKSSEYAIAISNNHRYFEHKYGIPIGKVLESSHYVALNYINAPKEKPIRVLEINGGFSNTLNMIKYKYPNSEVHAIDSNPLIVHIASNYLHAICCDIEKAAFPFEFEHFDYIIAFGILNCIDDTFGFLKKLKKYLKHDGHLILENPNANHISVLDALVHGHLSYTDCTATIANVAKHYYTTDDMYKILIDCGYNCSGLTWTYSSNFATLTDSQQNTLDILMQLPDAKDKNTYLHTGAIFDATPN